MRILAFDIGGTNIKYALCDEKFNLTDRHTVPTEAQKGGQELVQKIICIIESYENIEPHCKFLQPVRLTVKTV